MIQDKSQSVLLGGLSPPTPAASVFRLAAQSWHCVQVGPDTFSMWLGVITSELPDLET